MRKFLVFAAIVATVLVAVMGIRAAVPGAPVSAADAMLATSGDFSADSNPVPIFQPEPDHGGPLGENQNTGNKPPRFVGTTTYFTTLENYGPLITAGIYPVSDPEGDQITVSLAGADAASFIHDTSKLNSSTPLVVGLRLNGTPDYESPDDANGDRVYEVTIQATDADGSGETTELDVRLVVRDVDEAPVITGPATISFPEHSGTDVGQYTSADPEGEAAPLVLGGTDAGSFTFANGTLRFKTVPDYETRNSYSVTLTASDGTKTGRLDATITITDVDETKAIALTGSETQSIAENSRSLSLETYTATDPDGEPITWSLEGVDKDDFSISGGVLSLNSSPDYETKSSYSVTVKATAGSKSTARIVAVTVTDVDEAPVFTGLAVVSFAENSTAAVGRYAAADPEGGTATLTLGGTDAASFTFANGTLRFNSAPEYGTKNSYSVTFTASDGTNTATLDVTITIFDMGEVTGLQVTTQPPSLEVSVDWADDARADDYWVRWRMDGPGHDLNQGVRPATSNATITVGGSGDYVVRVEACNEAGCGPRVIGRVTVDAGPLCDRTPAVRAAIMDKGSYVADCTDFTATHLSDITGDLILENYGLRAVKAGDFDGLTSLGGLNLSHNQLTELPEDLFDDLTSLTWLQLNNNRLTELREDEFSDLTKLERLYLGHNRLTALPGGLIDDNSVLHTLILADNKLTSIPAELLDGRSKLTTLDVRGNQLTSLPSGLFEDLTSITTLERDDLVNPSLCARPQAEQDAILGQLSNISNCQLVTYADVALALASVSSPTVCDRTPAVRDAIVSLVADVTACANVTSEHLGAITGTLNLGSKEISTLKFGDLDGLSRVTAVDLQKNSLQKLPIGLFKDLSAATSVKLNKNALTTLSKLAFYGMDNLNSVTLSNNKLGTVPAGLFHGHTKLQQIYLDSNNLTGIRADTFDGLTGLQTLHLNGNKFPRLPQGIFKNLTGISTLQLDGQVNLGLCNNPVRQQLDILATLPDNWNCKMVTYADLAPHTRQNIEVNYIPSDQEDNPWLHEAWFVHPVDVDVHPPGGPFYGRYRSEPPVITLTYPFRTNQLRVYHELAHHYTRHIDIHADDPTARLSIMSGWLYFTEFGRVYGFQGPDGSVRDQYGDELALWTIVAGNKVLGIDPKTMESISDQEIPRWFFDTYTTDGTVATVDLDRVWDDSRSVVGNFEHHLSTLFGGYCSFEEGRSALKNKDLRNPWVDGGCVNRRPQEVSATGGGSGSLSVTWKAPLWSDGPEIDAYTVQWKSGDQDYDATRQAIVTTLENLSYTITGLTSGAEYTVRVAAVNNLGTSDFIDNHGHVRTAETTGNAG